MNDKLPCYEKLAFETKEQANANALLAEHKYSTKLKSYKCKHCNLWHLSSNTFD